MTMEFGETENTEPTIDSASIIEELIVAINNGIGILEDKKMDVSSLKNDLKVIKDIKSGQTPFSAIDKINNISIKEKAFSIFVNRIELGSTIGIVTHPIPNSVITKRENGWIITHIDLTSKTVDVGKGVEIDSINSRLDPVERNKKMLRKDRVPFGELYLS